MLPGRSATSHLDDRRQSLPLLRGGNDGYRRPSAHASTKEGDLGMTSSETQTGRLRRRVAHLLNSVAKAAWAADAASPVKCDLHRIGSAAYLAQRDILDMLGQPELSAEPEAGLDVAAALGEAARILAAIPEELQTIVTQRLQGRVSSLERRAFALRPAIRLG